MIFVYSSLLVHKLITKSFVYVFRPANAPCFLETFCYVRNFGDGCNLGTISILSWISFDCDDVTLFRTILSQNTTLSRWNLRMLQS